MVGFRKQQVAPEYDPYVDFGEVRELLEFLEHVVLCERLVVPITRYTAQTDKIINGKKSWIDFAVFRRVGDLNYTTERLVERLETAGVIHHAQVNIGEASADKELARSSQGLDKPPLTKRLALANPDFALKYYAKKAR